MKVASRELLALITLTLAGCQTTDDSDWIRSGQGTPFNQAERSCMELTDTTVSEDGGREHFFVHCMEALGWTPKPGVDPVEL